jgi:hypothetical protein
MWRTPRGRATNDAQSQVARAALPLAALECTNALAISLQRTRYLHSYTPRAAVAHLQVSSSALCPAVTSSTNAPARCYSKQLRRPSTHITPNAAETDIPVAFPAYSRESTTVAPWIFCWATLLDVFELFIRPSHTRKLFEGAATGPGCPTTD